MQPYSTCQEIQHLGTVVIFCMSGTRDKDSRKDSSFFYRCLLMRIDMMSLMAHTWHLSRSKNDCVQENNECYSMWTVTLQAQPKSGVCKGTLTSGGHQTDDDGGGGAGALDEHSYQNPHHQACHRVGEDGTVLEDVPCHFAFPNKTNKATWSYIYLICPYIQARKEIKDKVLRLLLHPVPCKTCLEE